jgi:hypothetical protein
MARPKKNVNIDYSQIDDAPQGTVHKLNTYATVAGVSGPTARTRIAEHYGDRVTFMRGRKGGFIIADVLSPDSVDASVQETSTDDV